MRRLHKPILRFHRIFCNFDVGFTDFLILDWSWSWISQLLLLLLFFRSYQVTKIPGLALLKNFCCFPQFCQFCETKTNSNWNSHCESSVFPIYLWSLDSFGLDSTASVIVMALLKTRWHYSKNVLSLLRRFYIDPSKEGIFAIRTAVVTNYRYLAS